MAYTELHIEIPHGYTPRAYQLGYWGAVDRGVKRTLLVWHRRAGKDECVLHRAARAAIHERVGTYWHMLPAFEQARKAIWNAVDPHTGQRRIDMVFPRELRQTTQENEMFIRFKNGSTWQLVGSDNYNSLVGTPPVGIAFSEWALANPGAWAYLAPILVENGGWADFITTPRGKNHVHSMLATVKDDPKWFTQVLTVEDTGFPLAAVEEQRREYIGIFGEDQADALIDQEYFCRFEAAILGAYYGRELATAEQEGRTNLALQPIDGVPVDTAWDLGVGAEGAMAIWWFQDLGAKIHVLDYYEATGMSLQHFLDEKNNRPYEYRGATDYVPHDARQKSWTATGHSDGTARQRLEVMRDIGLDPVLVPFHRKEDGINAVKVSLQRCFFHEKCAFGIEALRAYRRQWDEERRVYSREPHHDWASHGADAFRYLIMARKAKQRGLPPYKEPRDNLVRFPGVVGTNDPFLIARTQLTFNQLRDRNANRAKADRRLN